MLIDAALIQKTREYQGMVNPEEGYFQVPAPSGAPPEANIAFPSPLFAPSSSSSLPSPLLLFSSSHLLLSPPPLSSPLLSKRTHQPAVFAHELVQKADCGVPCQAGTNGLVNGGGGQPTAKKARTG